MKTFLFIALVLNGFHGLAANIVISAQTSGAFNTVVLEVSESSSLEYRFYEPDGILLGDRVELIVPNNFEVEVVDSQTNWEYQQTNIEISGSDFNVTTWYYKGLGSETGEYDIISSASGQWNAVVRLMDPTATESELVNADVKLYSTIVNNAFPTFTPIAYTTAETQEIQAVPEPSATGLIVAGFLWIVANRCRHQSTGPIH